MTIEEAIAHAKEVAEKNRRNCQPNTITMPNRWTSNIDCAEEHEQLAKWLEELKHYKDIGFTPEEIVIMAKFCKEQTSVAAITADMKIVNKLIKLEKYEKLEEAGKLITLPCKIGDTVYGRFRGRGEEIHKCRVVKTRIFQCKEDSEPYYFVDVEFNIIDPLYNDGRLMTCGYQAIIGRNHAGWDRVFLTREEAEVALKGEEK